MNLYNFGFFLESSTDTTELTRILGFDQQLIIQFLFQVAAVLILFYFLGRLLFKPVREILEKRKNEIETTLDKIEADEKAAEAIKAEYEGKLKNIKAEADKILSHAHTRAVAREDEIVKEAHVEASRIMERAHVEVVREREQMKDDVRKEIIEVATLMAGKFVKVSLSDEEQRVLIHKTISEMGDDTWQN